MRPAAGFPILPLRQPGGNASGSAGSQRCLGCTGVRYIDALITLIRKKKQLDIRPWNVLEPQGSMWSEGNDLLAEGPLNAAFYTLSWGRKPQKNSPVFIAGVFLPFLGEVSGFALLRVCPAYIHKAYITCLPGLRRRGARGARDRFNPPHRVLTAVHVQWDPWLVYDGFEAL